MSKKYTKDILEPIVKDCRSVRQVMMKLNLVPKGGNSKIMTSRIKNFGIDMSHFKRNGWRSGMKGHLVKQDLSKILCKNSVYSTGSPYQSGKIKALLFSNKLKENVCENGCPCTWFGEKLTMELHHEDGDSTNNELSNLKILCPNCHSITKNFRGKNIKKVNEANLVEAQD